MFRVLLLLATFMQVYFNLLNLQQMIIINALLGLRRRRLIAIELHRRILRRRRGRHRRRFWRLPRPMNSWFEIHYNDPLIPNDYFKEQLRVRKETFEVILNHLNPHLTRQDTAMHDCILRLYIAKSRYLGMCVSSHLASTYFLTALHCFLPLLPDMTRSEAGHGLF